MRTLLIFIVLALIIMIGKRMLQKPRNDKRTQRLSGNMVQCANCGIFVPENEALVQEGRFYCSSEHRDAAHNRS